MAGGVWKAKRVRKFRARYWLSLYGDSVGGDTMLSDDSIQRTVSGPRESFGVRTIWVFFLRHDEDIPPAVFHCDALRHCDVGMSSAYARTAAADRAARDRTDAQAHRLHSKERR